jgi:hypothetical protein
MLGGILLLDNGVEMREDEYIVSPAADELEASNLLE